MANGSKPDLDDFLESVSIRCLSLQLDGHSGKDDDLDACTSSVPPSGRYSETVRRGCGKKQGGSDGPTGNHCAGYESRFNGTLCGGQHF
ncbi:hypothetical protein OGATHE_000736 [Ogataea polymorpha]|uniref:Uncharacterized protein n=1 Tax=Ogataea polymorpha TaxID=460523 RepID=A0A9P8TH19_9ASCO|nr:hypothetical protein OGATHE_000736 [Ogataea polymorpha]